MTARQGTAKKSAPIASRITGPVILNYSFGPSQTGSYRTSASGTSSCRANACTFTGQLKSGGKVVGKFSGSYTPGDTATQGYFKVTFEDIIISS